MRADRRAPYPMGPTPPLGEALNAAELSIAPTNVRLDAPRLTVVASSGGPRLERRPPLPNPSSHEVIIQVEVAGICRTDLYAGRCQLGCPPGRILGHEFAGVVKAVGAAVDDLDIGTRVTANPFLPCEKCPACEKGEHANCQTPLFLGVDRDGAFADDVAVPRRAVHVVPPSLTWREAAYVEPVAASLAVISAPLPPGKPGLVVGAGRIALLTLRILKAYGFEDVEVASLHDLEGCTRSYAFVVETNAAKHGLGRALDVVESGGLVVLKSRPAQPVPFALDLAVRRQLTLVGVHYAPFADAIELLASRRLQVDDLLGPVYGLDECAHAFAADQGHLKRFLSPGRTGGH